MSDVATAPTRPAADKREAILDAALRVIARLGLHAAPMSVVAREAGVAAGTLYLYFPSKEAMINDLYLELLREQYRAVGLDALPATDVVPDDPRAGLWDFWRRLARWHLDHPDASNVLQQCQASGILGEETRATHARMDAAGVARFEAETARGMLRDLPRQVFYALLVGPIFVLAQLRATREIVVTDEVLRLTFDGVCRSVLP